jgi:hypothetical protein
MELAKTIHSKNEIIQSVQESFDKITVYVESTSDEIFY